MIHTPTSTPAMPTLYQRRTVGFLCNLQQQESPCTSTSELPITTMSLVTTPKRTIKLTMTATATISTTVSMLTMSTPSIGLIGHYF